MLNKELKSALYHTKKRYVRGYHNSYTQPDTQEKKVNKILIIIS